MLPKIERARRYLHKVPGATQGANGDDSTYKACAITNDFDLSEQETFELISVWNQNCNPPWTDEELRQKIRNVKLYGTGVVGSKLVVNRENKYQRPNYNTVDSSCPLPSKLIQTQSRLRPL